MPFWTRSDLEVSGAAFLSWARAAEIAMMPRVFAALRGTREPLVTIFKIINYYLHAGCRLFLPVISLYVMP